MSHFIEIRVLRCGVPAGRVILSAAAEPVEGARGHEISLFSTVLESWSCKGFIGCESTALWHVIARAAAWAAVEEEKR